MMRWIQIAPSFLLLDDFWDLKTPKMKNIFRSCRGILLNLLYLGIPQFFGFNNQDFEKIFGGRFWRGMGGKLAKKKA